MCLHRHKRRMLCVVLMECFLLAPVFCFSQELITDRPDQTESSSVAPVGYFQWETGWTYSEFGDHERFKNHSFPETLWRYGLIDNLELRFGFMGYNWEEADGTDNSSMSDDGCGDTEIGMKLRLWEEDGWRPETAVLTHLSLPTGKEAFSSNRTDPSYRLAFSHTLTDDLSLGYNLAQNWVTDENDLGDRDTRSVLAYSAVLGLGVTEELGTFIEFFGESATGKSDGPANSIDFGWTYLLSDNLQIDMLAGIGLSDKAADWFIGTGVVYRFGGSGEIERVDNLNRRRNITGATRY